jgi:basic membrane protein A and related proteins
VSPNLRRKIRGATDLQEGNLRRLSKIAAVVAVASLTLAGCGRNDETTDTPGATDSSAPTDLCAEATGDGPKVGLAYDVGGRGDQSFNDSAFAGLEKAVNDLGATCVEGEATDGEAESAREGRLREMADAGMNPVIGVGFAYSFSVNVVAPDYPDVSFAVIDGFDPDAEPNDNVAYLGFAEHEGSYLVGAAAALKSEAGHIGFVGGVNNDLIKKFEAGYTAGARAVNPDIEVSVNYIEESDLAGFGDPAGGKEAATAQFDKGADIVYHASGASGSGVFEAATEADAWAIGVDSDQYLTAPADQQAHILTSMLKRVDVATFNMVKSVADGSPLVSYTTYDLAADGVGYSTSGGYIDDITSDLDGFADQIRNGEIEVPTVPGK